MRRRWIGLALIVGALALVAASCGGGDDNGGSAEGSEDVTGDISAMAIWGGEEQASFQAVIDGFNELYPNVNVKYTSGGDNLAPLLSTAVQGGNPPDIACIGQPGLMAQFAERVPGFYFLVGSTAKGIDPAAAPINHSPQFMLDEGALEVGTRAMLQVALDTLHGADATTP